MLQIKYIITLNISWGSMRLGMEYETHKSNNKKRAEKLCSNKKSMISLVL